VRLHLTKDGHQTAEVAELSHLFSAPCGARGGYFSKELGMWLACWRLCRQKRRSRPTAPTAMWLACWRLCRPMCGKAVPFHGQVLCFAGSARSCGRSPIEEKSGVAESRRLSAHPAAKPQKWHVTKDGHETAEVAEAAELSHLFSADSAPSAVPFGRGEK
jgi:hypothetical protein